MSYAVGDDYAARIKARSPTPERTLTISLQADRLEELEKVLLYTYPLVTAAMLARILADRLEALAAQNPVGPG